MKLSECDKREIIRLNREEGVSQKRLAEMFGIGIRHIEDLICKYNLHGEKVLSKGPNRKYPPEFKMEVIMRHLDGESKTSLAVEYGIESSMIAAWLKRYEKDGYNGLIDKKKGRPPRMKKEDEAVNQMVSEDNDEVKSESADKAKIRLLERKNRELEAEVAYLKKLNALVRERKKKESRKK